MVNGQLLMVRRIELTIMLKNKNALPLEAGRGQGQLNATVILTK